MYRERKKLKLLHITVIFAVFILFFVGVFHVILYSDIFKVKKLEISGSSFYDNDYLISASIVEIIKNHPYLGFLGGDNILFWLFSDPIPIAGNKIIHLQELNKSTNLIDRRVNIAVKERGFFGVSCFSKNCFVFDDSGLIFSNSPDVNGSLILKIENINNQSVLLGNYFLPSTHWVRNILETIALVKSTGFYVSSAIIKESSLREWELLVYPSLSLLFDLSFVPEDLDRILSTAKDRLDLEKLSYLDFRVKGRIYYK